jgi:hypothetical protein
MNSIWLSIHPPNDTAITSPAPRWAGTARSGIPGASCWRGGRGRALPANDADAAWPGSTPAVVPFGRPCRWPGRRCLLPVGRVPALPRGRGDPP